MGDDPDGEGVLLELGDGKADAVDGDGALADEVAAVAARELEFEFAVAI